jgi:hypothetical protein
MITPGAPQVVPTVLAMLFAERVSADKQRRGSLHNIYHGLQGAKFPLVTPVGVVYIAFTGGMGLTTLAVRLMRPEGEGESIFSFDFATEFRSPLDVREAAVEPPMLTFVAPGAYRWQVRSGGTVVYERFLMVDQVAGG